jgi:hypothetical protein
MIIRKNSYEERRTVRSAYCDDLGAGCDTSFDAAWTVLYNEAVLGIVAQLLSSKDEGCVYIIL